MFFDVKAYIKNRRFASTYPSIDAKLDSKTIKILRKFRDYMAGKCLTVLGIVPLIVRPRSREGVIDDFEILGMLMTHAIHGKQEFNLFRYFLGRY